MSDSCKKWKHTIFKYMTLRLMAAKYAYYILSDNYIKDVAYDLEEKDWYKLGRELGLLKEDETSPCIDFDYSHPLANDAALLGEYLRSPSNSDRQVYEELLKKYNMG